MLFSTTQLSRVHRLEEHSVHLVANGVELKRINSSLLLGTVLQQNLNGTKTSAYPKKAKASCSISDQKTARRMFGSIQNRLQ